MKITALLDNETSNDKMKVEHGLSLYIETETCNLLFDTGQTDLFAQNAEVLGADLSRVDAAIISHGHYDHGGGLKRFMNLNKTAPVYVHNLAFEPYYNGTERYIGLDPSLKPNDRFVFTGDETVINENAKLFSCAGRKRKYGNFGRGLNVKRGDVFVPDEFLHEQYLLLTENGRRVLVSGCSHKGILNLIEWFEPDCFIGGFHFFKVEPGGELAAAAGFLNSFPVEYYACHCTGLKQFLYMKNIMNRLHYLSCGASVTV